MRNDFRIYEGLKLHNLVNMRERFSVLNVRLDEVCLAVTALEWIHMILFAIIVIK